VGTTTDGGAEVRQHRMVSPLVMSAALQAQQRAGPFAQEEEASLLLARASSASYHMHSTAAGATHPISIGGERILLHMHLVTTCTALPISVDKHSERMDPATVVFCGGGTDPTTAVSHGGGVGGCGERADLAEGAEGARPP
jgi:hypothetical protein